MPSSYHTGEEKLIGDAAIVPVDDLERLNQMDAERQESLADVAEMGRAFTDQSPEQIDQEVERALVEGRAQRGNAIGQ